MPREVYDAISRGESVIIEGSQGFGISLYYGTYPFVTSKDTSASALASDVGVGPTRIDEDHDILGPISMRYVANVEARWAALAGCS